MFTKGEQHCAFSLFCWNLLQFGQVSRFESSTAGIVQMGTEGSGAAGRQSPAAGCLSVDRVLPNSTPRRNLASVAMEVAAAATEQPPPVSQQGGVQKER
eukprot:g38936.t1